MFVAINIPITTTPNSTLAEFLLHAVALIKSIRDSRLLLENMGMDGAPRLLLVPGTSTAISEEV
jgi:hypothetical protein